ncbi:MAG: glycosyltransferase family 4 protein [Candidatus Magasanikbacteria bacterium]|nr:glycosyltransferase family 4 protein [Candidatus Magasanikbacteria bacterium]
MIDNIKKRILIFSTAYFPFVGGAEVAVKEITGRITDVGFVMITSKLDPKLPRVEKVGNIEVHRMGKGNCWDKYRLIWQGPRYASNLGHFNAIWGIMASYAGFAALRYKKGKNTPFLLTLQEGDSRWQIYKHVWWCWPYFKQIFKRADKIQAISNYLADWAKKMGAKCEVEVVPNGVDLEKFQITNDKLQTNIKYQISNIKKQLNISENDKIVITVSRLVKKNGVEDLIKAIKILNIPASPAGRQYPISSTHFLIAGEGELKNKLVKLVNCLGLVDRVHFLGHVNHEELPKYLWASDVFCRPSLSEGLGSAFLEAMAAGLPIVGANVGGIPDFLKDNETGLFCKVEDPKDISENIKEILGDINLREKLIANGKQLVQEKYDWNLIASKMKNIFDSLCAS